MSQMPPQVNSSEPVWVKEVLEFWFEELSEKDWYSKREDVDARIDRRFRRLHETLVQEGDFEPREVREALARVVVLDQFSRNLFRGDPRAFAADPIARRIAAATIALGLDQELPTRARTFLYLPFEHSEDRADQSRALALFESMGDDGLTRYAVAHKAIIDRFGRFPHRNAVLGRESTPEEIEFLAGPASSF
jgi:uncharacterized protein (DUF924 family)